MMEIAEHCCFDVKITKEVHEYGIKNGHLKYNDPNGHPAQVEVDWA